MKGVRIRKTVFFFFPCPSNVRGGKKKTRKMYKDKGQNLGEMGRGILNNGLDVKCPPTGSSVWTFGPQLILQFGKVVEHFGVETCERK